MYNNKTSIPSLSNLIYNWYIVNAEDQILGRLASKVANYLMGKHKNDYTPYFNMSDYIIIINVDKIKVSGKKLTNKYYYSHSGYVGHLKKIMFKDKIIKNPKQILLLAIKNMLPKNKLSIKRLKRLKLCIGNTHVYQNHQPTTLNM